MSKGLIDSSFQYHLTTAKQNGVTKSEMAAILTHLAFYAGWPNAWAAFRMAVEVYQDGDGADGGLFGLGAPNEAFAQYFIGNSYLKPLTDPKQTVFMANVTFEPDAGTTGTSTRRQGRWTGFCCTDGRGWYQSGGQEARELHPGDVVTIPAGVKHWHGAAQDSWFSLMAVGGPWRGNLAASGWSRWQIETTVNCHKGYLCQYSQWPGIGSIDISRARSPRVLHALLLHSPGNMRLRFQSRSQIP